MKQVVFAFHQALMACTPNADQTAAGAAGPGAIYQPMQVRVLLGRLMAAPIPPLPLVGMSEVWRLQLLSYGSHGH